MLRDSLTDTQPKTEVKRSRRPLILLAFAAAACLAVGMLSYGAKVETEEPLNQDAMEAYLTTLVDHHAYVKEQGEVIADLIEEGAENQIAVAGAIAGISAALPVIQAAGPKILGGVKALFGNIGWGKKINSKAIDPSKLAKAYENSADFLAGIKKRFPKAYAGIAKLRQNLKIHHFELSGLIDDVRLLARSTDGRVDKTIRKLNLRKKFIDQGKMKKDGHARGPILDFKIWNIVIKNQLADLNASIEKCDVIIKQLTKLQIDAARTQDDLENQIKAMEVTLKNEQTKGAAKIKALEEQIKKTGCVNNGAELMKAIFTLGISCAFDSDTKKQLRELKIQYAFEAKLVGKLLSKFDYFNGLTNMAKTLVRESTGLLKTTKTFRQELKDSKDFLVNNYKEEDIVDNLGDEDFANEFAESLFQQLARLKAVCKTTMDDCNFRKKNLDNALIGFNKVIIRMEEEELTNLAGDDADQDALLKKIWGEDGLASQCLSWYDETSTALAANIGTERREAYLSKVIKALVKNKSFIMSVNSEGWHTVKAQMFKIVDGLFDAQQNFESIQKGMMYASKKGTKYLRKPLYRLHFKIGAQFQKKCQAGHATIDKEIFGFDKQMKGVNNAISTLGAQAVKFTEEKLSGIDCSQWAPLDRKPNGIDVGDIIKKGKDIYDKGKDAYDKIKGGFEKKKPANPWGPGEEELEEDLVIPIGEDAAAVQERIERAAKYSGCQQRKSALAAKIEKVKLAVEAFDTQKRTLKLGQVKPFPEDLDASLTTWAAAAKKFTGRSNEKSLSKGDFSAYLSDLSEKAAAAVKRAIAYGSQVMDLKNILII